MGCSGVKRFFKVVIPLVMPSILAAALMVFMRAFADFGTPLMIGEGYRTFPVEIYNQFVGETGTNHNFASAIAVIAIVITALIFLIQKVATSKFQFTMNSLHPIEKQKMGPLKSFFVHFFIYGMVIISMLPQIYLAYLSFRNTTPSGQSFTTGYSLDSYIKAYNRVGRSIGNTLKIGTRVENAGEGRMYFAVGGHPGFNVPMEAGTSFEDYCLMFDEEAHPYRIHLADSGAVTPLTTVYEMKDNKVIPLSHDLFDHDAVVLTHAAKTVKICSDRTSRAVTVSYPDFRYVGFWHKPKTDAPYVCVEPWTSLPSREGIVEKLALQADLLSLDPGKVWETVWTVTID
jgi:ABC-type sugar transport system permease subunit